MKNKNLRISDMAPEEIRIAMLRHGVTQSGIARNIGVSPHMIYNVIEGRSVSHRVRKAIAASIGKDLKEIWPGTYLYGGGPRKRGRPVCQGAKRNVA